MNSNSKLTRFPNIPNFVLPFYLRSRLSWNTRGNFRHNLRMFTIKYSIHVYVLFTRYWLRFCRRTRYSWFPILLLRFNEVSFLSFIHRSWVQMSLNRITLEFSVNIPSFSYFINIEYYPFYCTNYTLPISIYINMIDRLRFQCDKRAM